MRDLIAVGQALPFRVLDTQSRLLLNEGQTVSSERQFEMLNERGAWVERALVERVRGERAAMAPQNAVRQLFQQEGGQALATALIRAIGVHPPGTLVTHKSGEVGVVSRRPPGTARPSPPPTSATAAWRSTPSSRP